MYNTDLFYLRTMNTVYHDEALLLAILSTYVNIVIDCSTSMREFHVCPIHDAVY